MKLRYLPLFAVLIVFAIFGTLALVSPKIDAATACVASGNGFCAITDNGTTLTLNHPVTSVTWYGVAVLPAATSGVTGRVYVLNTASDYKSCTAGAGSASSPCFSDGTAWRPVLQ